MKDNIRIALAEDHDLVRQGMLALLEDEENINVVFDVPNGQELLDKLSKEEVDVILLDLDMPILDGHKALQVISEKYKEIKVIIISMHYERDFIAMNQVVLL